MERQLIIEDERGEHIVTLSDDGAARVDDVPVSTRVVGPGEIRLGPNEATIAWVAAAGDTRWVFLNGNVYELAVHRESRHRRRAVSGHTSLSAPMPATVVRVEVSPGGHVRRGDTLVILEAMKMELPIRADTDGIVTSVSCQAGDLVQPGVPLVEID
jgi:3-methylcrotonyl-CoA carboxylase alpha subunit